MYLNSFSFADKEAEINFLHPKDKTPEEIIDDVYKDYRTRSYNGSMYPFNILTEKLGKVDFEKITVFCGGNGCGKTTALNIIAEKLRIKRDNLFNTGRFFQDYLNLCSFSSGKRTEDIKARNMMKKDIGRFLPIDSCIIVSDDVFAFSMKQRHKNSSSNDNLHKAEQEYNKLWYGSPKLQSMADCERWKARTEALKSKSAFMQKYLKEVPEYSNGETAMHYFVDRMENPGLYLLDEPENSLSFENQIKLAEYISSSARFFNCQFIIATHSPAFLSIKHAKVYNFDDTPASVSNWTEISSIKEMYNFFKLHEDEFVG